MPGKTVTINFFSVENIYIVDLPGYGYASVSKSEKRQWGSLIGGYLDDGSRQLALVFSACGYASSAEQRRSDDDKLSY